MSEKFSFFTADRTREPCETQLLTNLTPDNGWQALLKPEFTPAKINITAASGVV